MIHVFNNCKPVRLLNLTARKLKKDLQKAVEKRKQELISHQHRQEELVLLHHALKGRQQLLEGVRPT